jgi:hypothetical protein
LKQLSGIAVASQSLLNSRHTLGPRSVGEDVENVCPIPEYALGASPDDNAIPFGGSPPNYFFRNCSYRIRIKELHVSGRGASHDRGGPKTASVYAVPPRIHALVISAGRSDVHISPARNRLNQVVVQETPAEVLCDPLRDCSPTTAIFPCDRYYPKHILNRGMHFGLREGNRPASRWAWAA